MSASFNPQTETVTNGGYMQYYDPLIIQEKSRLSRLLISFNLKAHLSCTGIAYLNQGCSRGSQLSRAFAPYKGNTHLPETRKRDDEE